jgi:hypothetical protein
MMMKISACFVGVKICFKCKRNLPLFLFLKDDSKYQVKAEKGKTKVCRLCNIKRSLKTNSIFARVEGKFITMEKSKFEIIKYFLK